MADSLPCTTRSSISGAALGSYWATLCVNAVRCSTAGLTAPWPTPRAPSRFSGSWQWQKPERYERPFFNILVGPSPVASPAPDSERAETSSVALHSLCYWRRSRAHFSLFPVSPCARAGVIVELPVVGTVMAGQSPAELLELLQHPRLVFYGFLPGRPTALGVHDPTLPIVS